MFRNYLKIAFRNLLKYRAYSFINILGLAVGITACMMILLYVNDELSYDTYNVKAERIYRFYGRAHMQGREFKMAVTPAPAGATLVHDYPEVVQYTRLLPASNMLIRYKDNVFNETRFFWADSTVFDVFTIPFTEGNPKTALNQPHTVVLTESLAKKYFGNEDPLNKIMNFEDGTAYTVSGVVKDCPSNSHFHYDIFASMASIEAGKSNFWINNNFYTYIVLKKGASASKLQAKFPALVKKYAGPQIYQGLGITFEDWEKKGNAYQFFLQPLTSIHLHSHLNNELEANSDIKYVYIFSIIAVFILLIACINFMNLSTARSITRSKEVGVRKVLGSNKSQLVKQFLIESFLLTFISILIAVLLVEIFLPLFNNLADKNLHTNYFHSLVAIPALIAAIIIVGLISGSYPAFFLSSFQPSKVLKGKATGSKGSWLRSGLVIFQFSISIILFIGTMIIYNQMKYIQDANLGFNKEHVLVVQRAWALENHAETFKDELIKNPHIINATNTNDLPGRVFSETVFKLENAPVSQQFLMGLITTDGNFAKTMGIDLTEGRYFSKNNPSDSVAVVLNESAVKTFNIKDPIGKRIIFAGQNLTCNIIGVVKDFHLRSLHQKIEPLVIYYRSGQTNYLPIRISSNDISGTISAIKNEWKKFVPNKPFEYFFLDEDLNRLYHSDQKTGEILTSFSLLAISIACLGLFGLAAFTTERRTKEIGIRKALGASVLNVIFILSKEFTKWVLIANIIAWPVAYFFMNKWLQDFAYRINVSIWIFILSGIIALFIALLTVISHAIKAARANPVKSLRYE